MEFVLDDGEALYAEFPDTFEMPSLKNRQHQQIGDLVKLIFRITLNDEVHVERMWVIITQKNDEEFTGTLDNQPFCTQELKLGQEVCFSAKHMIQIQTNYF